ncbi:A24 family peptidase [Virgibacillus ndiopensis]|uniref:A24 family peptidase n=1 Tax=Virgibacillus ndiopensis TaxID=2004408 RepID=UPI000C074641|nr:A24 family peptidase [Virgibacillus ndiopensis]
MFHVFDYLLIIFIITAFVLDIRFHKIPNWLTAGGILVGLVCHLILDGIDGFIFSGLGLLVGGVICLLLYYFKAIGAGDVKLFAAIGAFLGIEKVLYAIMYAIVFAGIIGIILLLITRTPVYKAWNRIIEIVNHRFDKCFNKIADKKEEKVATFPFMYAVLPAIIVHYYYLYI